MNFQPEKFFIGLMDFFSIILPGALLAYLIGNSAWEWVWGERSPIPEGPAGWLVFLFASYLLGHFIFLLSAWLDELYDWARNATLDKQIRELAWHQQLIPWWWRLPLWLVFKRERNLTVDRVGRIKRHYLGRFGASGAINNFQWSKLRLGIEHPESLALVQRFEADSKFFRSLVVVLLILVIWFSSMQRFAVAALCALLLLLALWRYMEQRHKATNQAYWAVLTLEGKNNNLTMTTAKPGKSEPTHAGGIVFKGDGKDRRFLLVEARKNPKEWVLPKGHIELDEHPRETAVREVREETGVWAEIIAEAGVDEHDVDGRPVRVLYYLMRARSEWWPTDGWRRQEWWPTDRWRRHEWLPLERAIQRATHRAGKKFLRRAAKRREHEKPVERSTPVF